MILSQPKIQPEWAAKEVEKAFNAIPTLAKSIRPALEHARFAIDRNAAPEYRNDIADLLDAIDLWEAACQQLVDAEKA